MAESLDNGGERHAIGEEAEAWVSLDLSKRRWSLIYCNVHQAVAVLGTSEAGSRQGQHILGGGTMHDQAKKKKLGRSDRSEMQPH